MSDNEEQPVVNEGEENQEEKEEVEPEEPRTVIATQTIV